MVRSSKVTVKFLARINGTLAMDLGHMNTGVYLLAALFVCLFVVIKPDNPYFAYLGSK